MRMSRSNSRPDRGGVLLKVLLVLGVLFAAAAVAWVVLLPSLVASTIHSKTGFRVKIDRLSVNPLTADALVSGFVLQNPEDWPEANFIEVRRFKADVKLFPLLGGRFEANEVVADIAYVTVVRNQQGVLNTSAFSNGFGGGAPAKGGANAPASPAGKSKGFLIHHLTLKLDQLVFADYSGRSPVIKKYDVNLNREMTEVDSVAKLLSPLTGSALSLVANAFSGLSPKDADLLSGALDTLQGAGKKTGETLKNLFHSLDNKKP